MAAGQVWVTSASAVDGGGAAVGAFERVFKLPMFVAAVLVVRVVLITDAPGCGNLSGPPTPPDTW
jgi:hypothetical protein